MASPRETYIDLVTYDVEFEGKMPPELNIRSISVTLPIKGIPKASLVIVNGSDENIQNFDFTDEDIFVPGKFVSISAGYHMDNKLIFEGIITEKGVKIKGTNSFEMNISCEDVATNMTKSRINNAYEDMTDSNILEDILGKYGAKGSVDSTSYKHEKAVQYNTTDWDYIVSKAEAIGRIVVVENGKVNIEKSGERGAPINLTLGKDVKSMSLSVDTKNQISKVKAISWDPESQKVIEHEEISSTIQGAISKYGSGFDSDKMIQLHSTTKMEKELLEQWVKAKLLKLELSRLRGSVSFQGTTMAVPNSHLNLSGFGKDLDGEAYISEVKHSISGGEWTTEVTIGADAEDFTSSAPNVSSPGAAGHTPSISGNYNAKVLDIEGDPKKQNRIKVDIPMITHSAGEPGGGEHQVGEAWARISNQYASGAAGSFFLPEIGDEVLISFLQNDPRQPIIVGMMHSEGGTGDGAKGGQDYEADKFSPYPQKNDNKYKGFVTKSKMKIQFNDVDKIITISTPGEEAKDKDVAYNEQDPPDGNVIIISEKDKSITITDMNKNTIKLFPDGINIESPKDITIKAEGKIDIQSDKTIDIKAKKDITINSKAGIDVKAAKAVAVEGRRSADLKSNGITTIKGTTVKIN